MGNHQTVPLLEDAMAIVKRQSRDGDLIFPFKEGTFSSIFPRACKALGIDDLRFHDLRHEGASRLFEKGYQIHEVAMFTGHADWSMLKRYTQLKAATLRRL
jgi:integrase